MTSIQDETSAVVGMIMYSFQEPTKERDEMILDAIERVMRKVDNDYAAQGSSQFRPLKTARKCCKVATEMAGILVQHSERTGDANRFVFGVRIWINRRGMWKVTRQVDFRVGDL